MAGLDRGAARDAETPAAPRIVLGVCGGIAAYKAVEVCRRLVDAGVHVIPVLTDEATRFVGAVTFSALASEPAQRSLWDEASPIRTPRLGQAPTWSWWCRRRRTPSPATPPDSPTISCGDAPGHPGPGHGLPRHAHRNVGAPVGTDNLATLERRGVDRPAGAGAWPAGTRRGSFGRPGRHRRPRLGASRTRRERRRSARGQGGRRAQVAPESHSIPSATSPIGPPASRVMPSPSPRHASATAVG